MNCTVHSFNFSKEAYDHNAVDSGVARELGRRERKKGVVPQVGPTVGCTSHTGTQARLNDCCLWHSEVDHMVRIGSKLVKLK